MKGRFEYKGESIAFKLKIRPIPGLSDKPKGIVEIGYRKPSQFFYRYHTFYTYNLYTALLKQLGAMTDEEISNVVCNMLSEELDIAHIKERFA